MRLRPEIAALTAYSQGRSPSPDGFKLSSNENPYPALPGVLEAAAAHVEINRYPDGAAVALRTRLADRYGVEFSEVIVGAGSSSLLQQLFLAAAGRGDEIVYAWRSFEAYPGFVTITGATSAHVPLTDALEHDLPALAAAVTERTRVVVVCSPNNPTGPAVSADAFEAFMRAVPAEVLVVLDEAYQEFVTDPLAVDGEKLIGEYPNLVITRTFSKAYGLAGLRVGYAIGPARLLAAARATAIPFAVTELGFAAALASLDRKPLLDERVAEIVVRRDRLRGELIEQGWAVPSAQGNFVWLPTGEHTTAAADAFFDADIAVRPFADEGIRISIGEEESIERILEVSATLHRQR
ncbi:aminotransferase class I/II-fold pyridoxal phosphate-dependent enzyme [Gryllotalpicola protaetiae]|uniref:Histidinol-phosphate aminotransferase n=1 Tax=Gryllotalpicola protaetiae TaxID=2419771 RepID=A0A387BM95_9MICO|nr:aminotransferase class I/II-fold pyridoxal phosphate-dependent enzyme [Gryllotalpicola protaetiae]